MKKWVEPSSDRDVAEYIRKRIDEPRGEFSWVTDGCTYEQQLRFVRHRNKNWQGQCEWREFVLDYAARLERGEVPPYKDNDDYSFPISGATGGKE